MLRESSRSIDGRGFRLGVDRRLATKHVLTVMDQVEQVARFWLVSPSSKIVTSNLSTWVNVGAFANGHIRRRRYKGHRRFAWVVSWDPVGHRDVVCGAAKVDGDGAFQGEQQLCTTIVEREDFRLGRKRRDRDQGSIDVGKHTVAIRVWTEHAAQPVLHHGMIHGGRAVAAERFVETRMDGN